MRKLLNTVTILAMIASFCGVVYAQDLSLAGTLGTSLLCEEDGPLVDLQWSRNKLFYLAGIRNATSHATAFVEQLQSNIIADEAATITIEELLAAAKEYIETNLSVTFTLLGYSTAEYGDFLTEMLIVNFDMGAGRTVGLWYNRGTGALEECIDTQRSYDTTGRLVSEETDDFLYGQVSAGNGGVAYIHSVASYTYNDDGTLARKDQTDTCYDSSGNILRDFCGSWVYGSDGKLSRCDAGYRYYDGSGNLLLYEKNTYIYNDDEAAEIYERYNYADGVMISSSRIAYTHDSAGALIRTEFEASDYWENGVPKYTIKTTFTHCDGRYKDCLTEEYYYDENGAVIESQVTTDVYDDNGRVATKTVDYYNAPMSVNHHRTLTYEYNSDGTIRKVVLYGHYVSGEYTAYDYKQEYTYLYDGEGRIVESLVWSYEYDAAGDLVPSYYLKQNISFHENGAAKEYTRDLGIYDPLSRVLSEREVTLTEYDSNGVPRESTYERYLRNLVSGDLELTLSDVSVFDEQGRYLTRVLTRYAFDSDGTRYLSSNESWSWTYSDGSVLQTISVLSYDQDGILTASSQTNITITLDPDGYATSWLEERVYDDYVNQRHSVMTITFDYYEKSVMVHNYAATEQVYDGDGNLIYDETHTITRDAVFIGQALEEYSLAKTWDGDGNLIRLVESRTEFDISNGSSRFLYAYEKSFEYDETGTILQSVIKNWANLYDTDGFLLEQTGSMTTFDSAQGTTTTRETKRYASGTGRFLSSDYEMCQYDVSGALLSKQSYAHGVTYLGDGKRDDAETESKYGPGGVLDYAWQRTKHLQDNGGATTLLGVDGSISIGTGAGQPQTTYAFRCDIDSYGQTVRTRIFDAAGTEILVLEQAWQYTMTDYVNMVKNYSLQGQQQKKVADPEFLEKQAIDAEVRENSNNRLFTGQMAGRPKEVVALQNK